MTRKNTDKEEPPTMKRSVAFAIVLIASVSAQAGSLTSLVEEPQYKRAFYQDITPPDPLTRTYALRVDADTDWASARIRVELTQGEMSHKLQDAIGFTLVPIAGLTHPLSVFSLDDTAVFSGVAPAGLPSSLVAAGDGLDDRLSVLPGFVETPTLFEVSWSGPPDAVDDIGLVDIAMITLSDDAQGWLTGSVFTSAGSGAPPLEESLRIRIGIPEPSTALLIGLALWLNGSRHTRSSSAAARLSA